MPDSPQDRWPGPRDNGRYGSPREDAEQTFRWITVAAAVTVVALMFMAVGGVIGYQFGEMAGELRAYHDITAQLAPTPQPPPIPVPAK